MCSLYFGCLLCLATLCHGFVPVPLLLKPKLRHTSVRSETVCHGATHLDASRYVLGYVSGTMIYLAISTVNDWLKLWLESNSKK